MCRIVQDRLPGCIVVVAAVAGVTDALLESASQAAQADPQYVRSVKAIRDTHLGLIRELFEPRDQAAVVAPLQLLLNELEDVLHGVELVRECTPRTMDLVMSFGERICAELVSRYLSRCGVAARLLDARRLLVTDDRHGGATVDCEESRRRILDAFSAANGEAAGAGEAVTVRAGGGLKGDGGEAGDPRKEAAQLVKETECALAEVGVGEGMKIGEPRESGEVLADLRVVLHRAASKRVHPIVDPVVRPREAGVVAGERRLAQIGDPRR